ncbi:sulfite exporter TauE/SafE family protein [Pedobacter frigidisoli]|uniref:sulfite exporter TauE/SafE family protein n=1 Tax=Pedobacter frigidisoli TaxID=2530455 RepID=UPI002930F654|nr:sulfite exporter TauE/SafE family protein [Pedobacter frigidisoli]
MQLLPLAFLMGFFGSLHCAVMCGPIMLGMPFEKKSILQAGFQLLLYQSGRILIYTLLGLLAGAVGSSIKIFSNQRVLGLFIGTLLILLTLLQFHKAYGKRLSQVQLYALKPLTSLMGKIFQFRYWSFLAGILNGLIPCGMVYLAMATALSTASMQSGGVFMFLFGMGTVPLMMMVSLGGFYLKKYIHFNTRKILPYLTLLLGMLFILRAAELGIPFFSPENLHGYSHVADCK